jgi:hypothetical protein
MRKALHIVPVALALLAGVLSGCGGGGGNDENAAATTSTQTSTSSGSTSTSASQAVLQAITTCKTTVEASALSDDVKSDLKGICDQAASGDEKAVRAAALEVCRKIVTAKVPDGSARDQALAACKRGTQPSAPGTGTGAANASAAIEAAIASCKQSVQSAPVSSDVKKDLEQLCEKAASGDQAAVRKASLEVCQKIVAANVPKGPARAQALAACKANLPSP